MPSTAFTEILDLAASSHNEFLNLINAKLDKYKSLPADQEYQSLPSLRYTKQIFYHHIQKIQRFLDSIKNAQNPNWPKDEFKSGKNKATAAAQDLEQDYRLLLERSNVLYRCTNEAVSILMLTISISESQKVIEQTTRLGKLTYLAFVFVPLSFTTSFFGMNVTMLTKNDLELKWWVALSVPVTGGAIALFFFDAMALVEKFARRSRV